MLDIEFQSFKMVICERARIHAHLHMRVDAYTRSIHNYWSRADLISFSILN